MYSFYTKFPKATRCFQYRALRIRYAISNLSGVVHPLRPA